MVPIRAGHAPSTRYMVHSDTRSYRLLRYCVTPRGFSSIRWWRSRIHRSSIFHQLWSFLVIKSVVLILVKMGRQTLPKVRTHRRFIRIWHVLFIRCVHSAIRPIAPRGAVVLREKWLVIPAVCCKWSWYALSPPAYLLVFALPWTDVASPWVTIRVVHWLRWAPSNRIFRLAMAVARGQSRSFAKITRVTRSAVNVPKQLAIKFH